MGCFVVAGFADTQKDALPRTVPESRESLGRPRYDFKKGTYAYEGRDESLIGVNPARVVYEILV